jgi:hypothetical protein
MSQSNQGPPRTALGFSGLRPPVGELTDGARQPVSPHVSDVWAASNLPEQARAPYQVCSRDLAFSHEPLGAVSGAGRDSPLGLGEGLRDPRLLGFRRLQADPLWEPRPRLPNNFQQTNSGPLHPQNTPNSFPGAMAPERPVFAFTSADLPLTQWYGPLEPPGYSLRRSELRGGAQLRLQQWPLTVPSPRHVAGGRGGHRPMQQATQGGVMSTHRGTPAPTFGSIAALQMQQGRGVGAQSGQVQMVPCSAPLATDLRSCASHCPHPILYCV